MIIERDLHDKSIKFKNIECFWWERLGEEGEFRMVFFKLFFFK